MIIVKVILMTILQLGINVLQYLENVNSCLSRDLNQDFLLLKSIRTLDGHRHYNLTIGNSNLYRFPQCALPQSPDRYHTPNSSLFWPIGQLRPPYVDSSISSKIFHKIDVRCHMIPHYVRNMILGIGRK